MWFMWLAPCGVWWLWPRVVLCILAFHFFVISHPFTKRCEMSNIFHGTKFSTEVEENWLKRLLLEKKCGQSFWIKADLLTKFSWNQKGWPCLFEPDLRIALLPSLELLSESLSSPTPGYVRVYVICIYNMYYIICNLPFPWHFATLLSPNLHLSIQNHVVF